MSKLTLVRKESSLSTNQFPTENTPWTTTTHFFGEFESIKGTRSWKGKRGGNRENRLGCAVESNEEHLLQEHVK